MCYSKLTFKGTSPVINEPYKFFDLKVTGETKMRQNMDMNFEQTLTISQYYFLKSHGTFVVPIILKRWMRPLTRKFLNFSHRIIVPRKYAITIFSFHWFCVVVAAHSVIKDSLCIWLCCLSCGSLFFRHHSWHSNLLLIGLNYIVQDLVFYLLSRLYPMAYRVEAFCLEIICSDPQGVLQVFPIQEFSTKNAENFVFLFFKPQPFLSFHAS